MVAPTDIDLPDITINNHSFPQGAGGIIKTPAKPTNGNSYSVAPSQVVVENYGKYNTKGDGIEITFSDTKNNENKVDTHIEYKNLENLEISVVEDIKKPENQKLAGQLVTQETISGLRKEFADFEQKSDVGAFISTTMARDSVVDGKYVFNYGNTEYKNPTRIFLSVNSAGMLWQEDTARYDAIGGINGQQVTDIIKEKDPNKKEIILTEFKGNLNLKNSIEDNKKYGTLIGIDHQLWDDNGKGGSGVTAGYRNSYSIAKNSGVINLGEEDGLDKNLVGMTIETEEEKITRQKLHNHVTINKGEININSENSIGIGLEDGGKVADDLYIGNINLNKNSKGSYGVRLKTSSKGDSTKYNQLRVFGSVADNKNEKDFDIKDKDGNIKIEDGGTLKKITVDGNGNGGFVVAQSLSSSATQYLAEGQGNGDNMPSSGELTNEDKKKYIGMFNKDLGADFKGFEAGKVNPIANIHGLNIEVNGNNSVGFLRHKDYSSNNKNDMIITNHETGAIKEIDFGQNAKDSVLIRSDMYGIDVQKDLVINSDGTRKEQNISISDSKEEKNKNIVLQATKTTWQKGDKKLNSIGHIINSVNLSLKSYNLIGMMASSSKDYDEKAEKLDREWKKDKAEIKNKGTINLTGKNVIGMAVLGNNKGIVENGKVSTVSQEVTSSEEKIGNISIYNDGEFDIKNSTIETSGKGSVAVYNTGEMNLTGTNNIVANKGAIGLYSEGGKINSTEKINISSDKDGIGIYATNNGKVTINNGTINITDGLAGVASIGQTSNPKDIKNPQDKTNITLDNSTLNYSGSGYALYTEKDGTIDIKNSTINLDGNAFGMEVEFGKENNQIKIDNNSHINVKSDGVTVFNIISSKENKFTSALSNLKENIGKALGNNKDLFEKIKADEGVDLWKMAMVDGGELEIDKNISQEDKNGEGDFYFKRFLGVRLKTTLKDGVKADATIDGDTANKYFDGKVTGLEIVSSSKAEGVEDTSVTLKNGSSVVANRLDAGKDGLKNSATVGIFSNFAKVNLEDGSSVVVEKTAENKKDEKYNGVGIFATNGSEVNVGKATVEVHGNDSIGIYGLASRIDKDGTILDEEYKGADGQGISGQGRINIVNNGTIDVSNGLGTVGIYAINNKKDAKDNSNSLVINKGTIIGGASGVNEKGEVKSSAGIYGDKTSIDNKGTIEIKDGSIKDGVKHGGVGIYAVNGSEIKDIGTLKLGDYATGVVVDSTSELKDTNVLEFQKDPNSKKIGKEKIGIAFNNIDPVSKEERVRNLETEIKTSNISGLRAVASNGGTLNVNKKITIGDNNNRGVIVSGGIVNNNSDITIKEETFENKVTSVGLVAIDKNSVLNNNGTINLNGEKSIGMIALNENDNSNNKIGKTGTINLNGEGNTGVYISNSNENLKLKNYISGVNFGKNSDYSTALYTKNSKIVIEKDEEVLKSLNNNNVLVKALDNSIVENNGKLIVDSNIQDKNKKSVGIVLDEKSEYTGSGLVEAKGETIGIYSKVGDKKEFESLNLKVDSKDKNTIGLALRGTENTKKETLLKGKTQIELANSISKEENKGIGILAKDTTLKIEDMELKYESGSGVGIYLKDGSTIQRNGNISSLWIEGKEGKDYSVGIYADSDSGSQDKNSLDIDTDITINKNKTVGIYNNKDNGLKYRGSFEVASADSIGIFNAENKNVEFLEGTINVKGNTGDRQASVGILSKSGSTVKNNGNIITGSGRDIGIYGENSVIENNGNITVNAGIGVYLKGDKSEFISGESGKISTGKNDTSETALYLIDGAKLAGIKDLKFELGNKDVGIYGQNTTLDGINLDISNSKGAYAVVVDKDTKVENTNISIGENAIGILGLDNNVEIKNSVIDSKEKENGIGIYLQNNSEEKNTYKVNKTDITLNKGLGIILQDNEKEKSGTLDLTESTITINNISENKNKSGVYVGKNNILNSKNNIYKITNDVGIFGREDSLINVNGGMIDLTGKSTGVYSNGGKVILDKEVSIGSASKDKVDGGAVFVKNGSIESGATIHGFGDNFYGLYLEGNGNIKNYGDIWLIGENTIGISQVGGANMPKNSIENTGNILVASGKGNNTSLGIYGRNTDINNKGDITSINNSIGIYWDNMQNKYAHSLENCGKINLSGENAMGAFIKGNADKVFIENISNKEISGKQENNLGIYTNNFTSDDFTVNNISLKDNSMGIYANNSNTTMNIGSIFVGDGVGKDENGNQLASFGVAVTGGDVTLNIQDKISAGKNGTALLNHDGNITINDIEKLDVRAGEKGTENIGALVHTNGGSVTFGSSQDKDKIELDIDGHFGFILENNGIIRGNQELKEKELALNVRENGTGIIFTESHKDKISDKRPELDLGIDKITVIGSEKPDNRYSKGVYYKNLGKITEDLSKLKIENIGKNTAGIVLNGTYGEINTGDIYLSTKAENSVAVIIKGNGENVTNLQGNIKVEDKNSDAENQTHGNIGIEAQNSSITTKGNIEVGKGYNFKNSYPVGIYAINSDLNKRYSYKGEGNLTVGNFANGIFGKNVDIEYNGDIISGVGASGILSENDIYKKSNKTTVNGNITVGDDNLPEREKGTGIFASNSDVNVTSSQMTIKNNRKNIGVLSMEEGDIDFAGNVNITGSDKVTKGVDSSVGIYKFGSGNISIEEGNWTIGKNSFGVIANSEVEKGGKTLQEKGITITNNSNMEVKKGSVGIYSIGNNTLENNGLLKVEEGAEDKDSSIGIYMENNKEEKSFGYNNDSIIVSGKNSIGVQAVGNVEFHNKGTIDVLKSGIGVFATNGASIYNDEKGTINLGLKDGKDSEGTVGMFARGENSLIVNNGTINANNGIGMYIEDGARLENHGEINLKNGIGIKGDGNLVNTGNIKIETGFGGIDIDNNSDLTIPDDIIKINGNFAVIGPNYQSIGGTLDSDIDLSLKNPKIDISTGKLGFDAPNISGGISLAPNFATMGNGYEISVPDFAEEDVNIDVNTSPLFVGELEKGDLTVNKVAYKDIMKDYQYENFYNSLDKALQSDNIQDTEALKNMNSYLEGFGKNPEFYSEYDRVMKETRGSIYSHVQSRIQDINRTFDNAFDEMEESYNLSKDTDKFSIIYTDGDYKNNKNFLPNYDYKTTGVLYMKEYEGINYNEKFGYSLGITGSKFKFDTFGKSEENIISLKGGVHNVKSFEEDLDMITRLEVGLNYHETERTTVYGINSHSNDSDFWSYNVILDNKFRKDLYQNYQNRFGIYLGTKFEYGRFTDIKEDGTLALEIKGNDYFSAKAMTGFNGAGRKYLGNDWTGKIIGDIGYSYDFGKNYNENQSKLKNSNEGYVSLMNELETKGKASAKLGIGLERLNHLGVTLEGEVGQDFERDEDYWRVGLRFNYKFNQEDVITTLRNTFNFRDNHFAFDKDNLTKDEEKIVEIGSKIIDKYDIKGTIVLEGHTDSYGSVKYNQDLSERRAETVKKEFVKKVKKNKNIKYKTKGYSELKPIDTNKTKQGRANNRRTEIKFYSNEK